MTDGIENYLRYLKAKGYTEGTISWQKSHLLKFRDYLNQKKITLPNVTDETIRSYLAYLKTHWLCDTTRQSHLSALKGFFAYLSRMKSISANPAGPVEPVKKSASLPTVLTEAEVLKILKVPDIRTPVGLRDRTMLELLYSSGVRRKELIGLNVADVDLDSGYLRVNQGKNRKDRLVPVGETACKFIEAYLKLVRWWFQKDPTEPALFISEKGKRLSLQLVNYMVKKIIKKSGITKKITPHTFRHTMATHLLKNRADIRYIQAMLGHASVMTTEIYTKIEIEDLKKIHRRAHPRGRR
jgi:integrase/recombinase XerD